jgi:hypothetical protein
MASEEPIGESDHIVYLLGFSPRLSEHLETQIRNDLPYLECIYLNDVTAWYVHVERSLFEGPQAESNLSDLNWLTPKVLAHQHALDLFSSLSPFYPMSFGTLFSSIDAVQRTMVLNEAQLTKHFISTDGMQEWGVRIIVSWPLAVKAYQVQFPEKSGGTDGTGFNYLRQQKKIRERDQQIREWIQMTLSALNARIEELSVDTFSRRIQATSGDKDQECMGNIALLIDRDRAKELIEWIDNFNANTKRSNGIIHLVLTGPWPLMSFCPELISESSIPISV